jgi:hypothetical protein
MIIGVGDGFFLLHIVCNLLITNYLFKDCKVGDGIFLLQMVFYKLLIINRFRNECGE